MKAPYGVEAKHSLPGLMRVMKKVSDRNSHHTVYTIEASHEKKLQGFIDSMKTVYDNGKIDESYLNESFDEIRKRVSEEWERCAAAFLDGEGQWKKPLDTSILDKQRITAETINAENGNYVSNTGLFTGNSVMEKLTEEIDKRSREIIEIKEMERNHKNEMGRLKMSQHLRKSPESIQAFPPPPKQLVEQNKPKSQSEYQESGLNYPLMRLNALLDNLESKIEKK